MSLKNDEPAEDEGSSPIESSVNSRKREEMERKIQMEEEEYQKLLSRRPTMGSGRLGGTKPPIIVKQAPSDQAIMETMQRLDIDWDDAKSLLSMQHESNAGNQSPESDKVRHSRLQKIRTTDKLKEKRRLLQEEEEKRRAQQEIAKKKQIARENGKKLEKKAAMEKQKQIRESQMHRDERIARRLAALDNQPPQARTAPSTSRQPANQKNPPRPVSSKRYQLPDSKVTHNPDASQSVQKVSPSKSLPSPALPVPRPPSPSSALPSSQDPQLEVLMRENRRLKQKIEALQRENDILMEDLGVLQLLHTESSVPAETSNILSQSPPSVQHPSYPSSSEWNYLLQCPPTLRDRILQEMCREVARAEDGEILFPSLEYIVCRETDRLNATTKYNEEASMPPPASLVSHPAETKSAVQSSRRNHTERESLVGVSANGTQGEENVVLSGDDDEAVVQMSKEELREQRLKHLSR